MKEKILMICLACLPVLMCAQEQTLKLNKDLEIGEELVHNYTSVKFIKVLSDSRCPKQVTCIWAGEATVLLGITTGGVYTKKEVIVSGGAELTFEDDLKLLVSHLTPYPEKAKRIAPEDYCLKALIIPGKN